MRLILPVLIVVAVVIAGCASQPIMTPGTTLELPPFLDGASDRVRAAYAYALTNPHELEKYPCYCGCVAMNHTSNLSCYVKSFDADGNPTFDNHASGCGVCVDITQDVMRLSAEHLTSIRIRAYIDDRYSSSGPGTHTPLPTR